MEEKNLKLIRCMIISSTKEESENFGKTLFKAELTEGFCQTEYKNHEIKSFCRWPQAPKGLPEFTAVDVLIVRVKDEKEWLSIVEFVNEFALIHFKIVVWDTPIPSLSEQSIIKPNLCLKFSETTPENLFEEMIKSEKEIEDLLLKVFKNFDKGGDGFIDMSEMEAICRELGVDTTKTDFQETLRSLDVNNDNKISFEELCDWWKKGRQSSKLMETLITLRLATSNFLNTLNDSEYLKSIKERVELIQIEKKELINSFVAINIEKVTMHPEAVISVDGFFGGEKKELMSKAYCQMFEKGLKSSHYFVILEFELKDPSKMEMILKNMELLINNIKSSLKYISRPFAEFMNNEITIMAIKKDEKTICISAKLRRKIKEQLTNFESTLKGFLDETITQNVSLSFTLSGEIEKVKENPDKVFVDTFSPAASIELKSEVLRKNVKGIFKVFEDIPRPLRMWLHSYNGGKIELNFNLDYVKSLGNSFFNFPCNEIIQFLKVTLLNFLKVNLAPFGGFDQYKIFYESFKENLSVVVNTPQIYMTSKISFNDLARLFN